MRALLLSLLVVLTLGCGDKNNETPDSGAAPDAGGADMVVEADMGPAVMCPIEGYLFCGEKCIDVSFDLDHCGSCSNSCTRGKMTCMMGECLCLGDGIMCDDECYDAFTSREHCGNCETTCTSAEACVDGGCVPISEQPEIYGVLVATNEGRAEQQDCGVHGIKPAVGPVRLNELLTTAAQGHAEDMAAGQFLAHEGSDGSMPADRATRAGYSFSVIGENVAVGYDTPPEVVAGWIDSDGHCNNLMNGGFEEMGVGYAISVTGEPYWAQLFGTQ